MAAIKGRNTRPEMQVRRALHAGGLRYQLHRRDLPGRPDLVFPRHKAVVFVHGCFWHRHDCHFFKWPATREEFWREKIGRNQINDDKVLNALAEAGWRIGIVWECALKGPSRPDFAIAMQELTDWVRSDTNAITIRGE